MDNQEQYLSPATDLLLSLLAVFVVLFVVFLSLANKQGLTDLTRVYDEQNSMRVSLAAKLSNQDCQLSWHSQKDTDFYLVPAVDSNCLRSQREQVQVKSTVSLARQRFTFGANILFSANEINLNKEGEKMLDNFASVILEHIDSISEIRIEGHADKRPPSIQWGDNLNLAAQQAMVVYKKLQAQGVSPTNVLMSASSFGHFNPIDRKEKGTVFSDHLLNKYNSSEDQRSENRRIEIEIIFSDAMKLSE